jgi:hypothetical protein
MLFPEILVAVGAYPFVAVIIPILAVQTGEVGGVEEEIGRHQVHGCKQPLQSKYHEHSILETIR